MPGGLSINLSPRKKPTLAGERIFAKTKLWLGVILIGYILLAVVIFGFGAFFSFRKGEIKKEVTVIEGQIKKLEKKESLELVLKGRMAEIEQTLGSRTSYAEIINKIQSFSPQGISYQTFDFSKGKILLSGEAQNVAVLGDFLRNLRGSDFSQVNLTSLERSKEGGYSFSLGLALKK